MLGDAALLMLTNAATPALTVLLRFCVDVVGYTIVDRVTQLTYRVTS